MTDYILFPTTRTFIRGMKAAETAAIPHRVMAVPTHITHECGMCLQVEDDTEVLEALSSLLKHEKIDHKIVSEK